MKIITLVLFLLSACAAQPHRVCSVATIVDKGGSCTSIGRDLGPQASDVAIWRPTSGGAKWCMSMLDAKTPVLCSTLVASTTEQAADMVRAQQAQLPPIVPPPSMMPKPAVAPPADPPKEAPKP